MGGEPTAKCENAQKGLNMTNREFFTAVSSGIINDEVIAHATSAIKKMDTVNANRKSTPSKTSIANGPIKTAIVALLQENGAMVASAIGIGLNISTSKASALCRQLVDDNVLTVEDVKVKGKGSVKQYSIATPSVE